MNLPFTIAIEEPCNENWDKMQSRNCGRFCHVCDKTVVDFTKFTDAEFIAFFHEYDEKDRLCGRLTEQQLNMTIPPKLKPVLFWRPGRFAAASLMAALSFTSKADAQPELQLKKPASSIFQAKPESALYEKLMVITGTVYGPYDIPLRGARIEVQNTVYATTTDEQGHFTLELQEQDRGCVLICTASGSVRQEIILQQPGNLNIVMKDEPGAKMQGDLITVTAGEVGRKPLTPHAAVSSPTAYVKHKTLWQRITRPFRRTRKA